jgi:hypothetical protein
LETDDVMRFLKPGDEFIVEVGLGSDADVVSPSPRPVVDSLDDVPAGHIERRLRSETADAGYAGPLPLRPK